MTKKSGVAYTVEFRLANVQEFRAAKLRFFFFFYLQVLGQIQPYFRIQDWLCNSEYLCTAVMDNQKGTLTK